MIHNKAKKLLSTRLGILVLKLMAGLGLMVALACYLYFATPVHWERAVQGRIRSNSYLLRNEALQLVKQFAVSNEYGLTLCKDKLPKPFKDLDAGIVGERGEICLWMSKNHPDIVIVAVQGAKVSYTIIVPLPNEKSLEQVCNNVVYRGHRGERSLYKISPYMYEVQ